MIFQLGESYDFLKSQSSNNVQTKTIWEDRRKENGERRESGLCGMAIFKTGRGRDEKFHTERLRDGTRPAPKTGWDGSPAQPRREYYSWCGESSDKVPEEGRQGWLHLLRNMAPTCSTASIVGWYERLLHSFRPSLKVLRKPFTRLREVVVPWRYSRFPTDMSRNIKVCRAFAVGPAFFKHGPAAEKFELITYPLETDYTHKQPNSKIYISFFVLHKWFLQFFKIRKMPWSEGNVGNGRQEKTENKASTGDQFVFFLKVR